MHTYAAIASHYDEPESGLLVHVAADDPDDAVEQCHLASEEVDGVYEGYDFTLWPVPCACN